MTIPVHYNDNYNVPQWWGHRATWLSSSYWHLSMIYRPYKLCHYTMREHHLNCVLLIMKTNLLKPEDLVSVPLPLQDDLCSPIKQEPCPGEGFTFGRAELWLHYRNPLARFPTRSKVTSDAGLPAEPRPHYCSAPPIGTFPKAQPVPRDSEKKKKKIKGQEVVKGSEGSTSCFNHWIRTKKLHVEFSRLHTASSSLLCLNPACCFYLQA